MPKPPLISKPNLYIVATPIGNLEDISIRGLNILKEVDTIVSEDTRTTLKLLRKYNIATPLKSYRKHNKRQDLDWVKKKLSSGYCIAFTSEAGTPSISDPGADLVREIRQSDLAKIIAIPGPSAITAALSICGWQTNPTFFTGFLSLRQGRRLSLLKDLQTHFSGAIVIYESVHRIKGLLGEIKTIFPNRKLLIARELTKLHEETLLLSTGEAANWDQQLKNLVTKGEFTIVISPVKSMKKSS